MAIRPATEADIPWLIEELKEFAKIIPDGIVKFPSDEYAADFLGGLVKDHVCLVESSRKGFIAGAINRNPLNPEKVLLSELFWWVSPQYRRGTTGYRLLAAFIKKARSLECVDYVTVSLERDSKVGDNTIIRLGFRPMERTFVMEAR